MTVDRSLKEAAVQNFEEAANCNLEDVVRNSKVVAKSKSTEIIVHNFTEVTSQRPAVATDCNLVVVTSRNFDEAIGHILVDVAGSDPNLAFSEELVEEQHSYCFVSINFTLFESQAAN